MKTLGKIVDATVVVGSIAVGFGAAKTIIGGVKSKSTGVIILGSITALIALYAFKEAVKKINE